VHSKRFRGIGEQRKTEERDFFAVLVRGGEDKKLRFFFPRPPLSFFCSPSPIFRAALAPKISFLSFSLLSNPRETLAAQATRTIATKYYCNENTREEKLYLQAIFYINIMGDKLLLNFGAKFQP